MEPNLRFVSLDIETGGLDSAVNPVLEVGLIHSDSSVLDDYYDLPKVRILVPRTDDQYVVSAYAASLHTQLWRELDIARKSLTVLSVGCTKAPTAQGDTPNLTTWYCVEEKLYDLLGIVLGQWGYSNEHTKKVIAAGKNVGSFDIPYLTARCGKMDYFKHRYLDPGAALARAQDAEILDLTKGLARFGMHPSAFHTSLGDAWDVIRLMRAHWSGAPIYG